MSLNLGVMYAAVALDDSDYNRKLAALEGKSESTFKKIAQLAAGYLTLRALTGFAGKAIQTYSDLEEETNKFNVTSSTWSFGDWGVTQAECLPK